MTVNWTELAKVMYPTQNYEDLSKKWRDSLAYPFVRSAYNFSMPGMVAYIHQLLGGDTRKRYTQYEEKLVRVFQELDQAGVANLCELFDQVDTREKFEGFVARTAIDPADVLTVLTFLIYWVMPIKKGLATLFKNNPQLLAGVERLRLVEVRSNLDLIEQAVVPGARQKIAEGAGVPQAVVDELVNRADFSRMPWASSATVSNIIGAGYGSIEKFATTDFERVRADFFRYGESIGKNLKFGNEIDNSHRIARILPKVPLC